MERFIFATVLALSLGLVVQGANYYVDGTAKGGDGSVTAPFATIQQAADVAQAGGYGVHHAGHLLRNGEAEELGQRRSRVCPSILFGRQDS